MDRLKGISARMRPKTATEAAAAAKAIPALPAAAAAQAVPVQVLADVAIAAARVIGIAAGDAVPIAQGKPPRGPLAAYKGSALFPAAAGAEKKLKKKRIIPGISPVLRDGADGVNPEDMVYYEGQGAGPGPGRGRARARAAKRSTRTRMSTSTTKGLTRRVKTRAGRRARPVHSADSFPPADRPAADGPPRADRATAAYPSPPGSVARRPGRRVR